ncbi:MAG: RraA family protein [Nocardioidaceae bacterium]
MPIVINRDAPALPAGLADKASRVDVPTLGHYLEAGFCDPAVRHLAGPTQMCGRAVTVRITAPDSVLVHKATELLTAGDVLVIDTGGDQIHAPVGGVVAHAIALSGAAGVVIDGVCTDLPTLREVGLPVYARGTSVLTTKLHGVPSGGINVPISCAGAPVLPGHLVLGDVNGVLVSDPHAVAAVLPRAEKSDENEPALLERLRSGEKLPAISAADKLLTELGVEPGR